MDTVQVIMAGNVSWAGHHDTGQGLGGAVTTSKWRTPSFPLAAIGGKRHSSPVPPTAVLACAPALGCLAPSLHIKPLR